MRLWFKISWIVQVVLILAMLIVLLIEPFISLALIIPFAFWQFISAIVLAFKLKNLDSRYKWLVFIYFSLSIIVFITLYYSTYISGPRFREEFMTIWISLSALLGIGFFMLSFILIKAPILDSSEIDKEILDQTKFF